MLICALFSSGDILFPKKKLKLQKKMKRTLAAMCAAFVAHTLTFPLETYIIRSQFQSVSSPLNLGRTCVVSSSSAVVSCGIYVTAYESLRSVSVPLAATTATLLTHIPKTAVDLRKKRAQSGIVSKLSRPVFRKAYGLGVAYDIPKSCIKFSVYEHILSVAKHQAPAVAGALAAFYASILTSLVCSPIQYVRNQLIVRGKIGGIDRRILKTIILYSVYGLIRNVIGYSLLEHLAPRA